MGRKGIEDRFAIEMDAYLKGIKSSNKLESEECNELLELGKALSDKDFSESSNKEEVFNKTLKNISKYKGEDIMKKSKGTKHPITKVASFALVCILGFSLMQASFAQDVINKIVRTISLGHITIYEEESSEIESYPVPSKLKGKVFDKDGNPIEVFSKDNAGNIYTADGEKIADLDFLTGEITTVAQWEKEKEEYTLVVENISELNDYTCFNVILPSYLPEGYEFDRAEFFKDENGIVENTKYIVLYFTNEKTGKYIYMQQRFADEETAYETGADKVEEIKINGVDAIMYDERNIDWEANGVIYMLNGREITKNELIKIAESIK
ncbi:DUF4367 domain-containing protein [Tissierella sp. MSJ-40]|uniref:DUF4367 domain-containing protein n=1 Tax=Tissierella simiarum TaxID=2841534 RepID=A0ABS6E593_9FIRM|nr:DUF4367 domain-containing protein [Tissierella simiarum]MBU5438082.1 DUF4367 domain-containing protein [Tissierella simiarum]